MPTVLEAATLVDVENGRVIKDGYVQITGEKIQSWGSRKDQPAFSRDTTVLTCPRQTLLPGLINSHAHLCVPSGGRPFYFKQSDEMALLTAVRNVVREQQKGVTTIRDCGDQNGVLFSLRQAFEHDLLSGPRLVLCGPPLTITGGHAHFFGGVADKPDEISHKVHQNIDAGADFIKLIGTGGGTPNTHPDRASYNVSQLKTAVDTAHASNRSVSVHCRGTPGIENALAGGVDHIEHACFEQPDGTLKFDAKLADRMARAGIFVTPTIQLYRDALNHLEKKQVMETLDASEKAHLARLPGIIDVKFEALQGFLAAGVPIVAGNDAGLPYTEFGCFWQELDALVAGGMTCPQAIAAATIVAARAIGLDEHIGSIQTGKQADLVIVDGDPTQDISALSQVQMVLQAGRIVFRGPDRCEP